MTRVAVIAWLRRHRVLWIALAIGLAAWAVLCLLAPVEATRAALAALGGWKIAELAYAAGLWINRRLP